MKQIINFSQFCDSFEGSYKDHFSYKGKQALFDYLEEYEDSCDTEVELDVVALCCEYTEYEDAEEYDRAYTTGINGDDYDNEDEYKDAIEEYISDNTQLIKLGDDLDEGFIILAY